MEQMKKLIVLMLLSCLVSCMVTKTQVGDYKAETGKETQYAKAKQIWLFWGIVPLGRTSVDTPADGNCEIVTKKKFVDCLITGITGGIVSTYTITVNVKE